jgi:hypothetical protein
VRAVTFKDKFLTALQSGADYETLLEIVRGHCREFLADREAYFVLQEIWLDFGFNATEDTTPLQDNLEAVMERVWYFGADIC